MTPYRDRLNAGDYDTAPGAGRTIAQLKQALKNLNQPTSGTKADLEDRLAKAEEAAGTSGYMK